MNHEKSSDSQIRVGVDEAARLFGVSGKTIRRALSLGALRYVVVRGRYKISFDSLVRWSQSRPAVRSKRDAHGIGRWVSQWKIKNTLYSPRSPYSPLKKGENERGVPVDSDETKKLICL